MADPRERKLAAASPGPGRLLSRVSAPQLGHHQRRLPARAAGPWKQRSLLLETERRLAPPSQVGGTEAPVQV